MVWYIKEIIKNMEHSSNSRFYLQIGQGEGRRLAYFDQSQPAIRSRFSIFFETVMVDKVRDLKKVSFLQ